MSHTPGPWRLHLDFGPEHTYVSSTNDLIVLGKAFGHSQEINTANARLMAAAPELLDAAGWFVNLVDELLPLGLISQLDDSNAVMFLYQEARAAIAKAKGESA